MQLDLRTLSEVAGHPAAVEVAIERLREIAQAAFAETLTALDVDTLRRDPTRFHNATRAVKAMVETLG